MDDALCKEARQRAVDAGLSLSGWVAQVLDKELNKPAFKDKATLLDLLACDDVTDVEFPRDQSAARVAEFP